VESRRGHEPLRLEAGKAVGDVWKRWRDGIEMVQSFLRAEVGEVVVRLVRLAAQEGRKLFVLFEEAFLK